MLMCMRVCVCMTLCMCVCVCVCVCVCMCMCVIVYLLCKFLLVVSYMFSLAFIQRATGPSVVCKGSDVTLQCVIVFISANNVITTQPPMWIRAADRMIAVFLPNHNLVFNFTTRVYTKLVITNVTLEDDNTVYICTTPNLDITSSVVLNVIGNMCKCGHSCYCWDECTFSTFKVKMNECSNDLFHSFCEDLFSLIIKSRLEN